MEQNKTLLENQEKMINLIVKLTSRVEKMEVKLQTEIDLSEFDLKKMKNLEEFKQFLSRVEKEKLFKAQVVGL